LKLRQFDLHLGFAGASASSEDVEDELRSVQDANTDTILDGLTLRRGELVVEDHEIGLRGDRAVPKLIDFAFPDVEARMRGFDPLTDDVDHLTTGRVGQPGQLFEMLSGDALIEGLQRSSDEYGAIHTHSVVNQLGRNGASEGWLRHFWDATLRPWIRGGGDEKAGLQSQIFEVGSVVRLGAVEDLFQEESKDFSELRPRRKTQLLEIGAVEREVSDRERRALAEDCPEKVHPTDRVFPP